MNHEPISFCDAEHDPGMSRPRLDVFSSRRQHHVRHPSPEGIAEVCPKSRSSLWTLAQASLRILKLILLNYSIILRSCATIIYLQKYFLSVQMKP